jgi:hypothetical protein
MKLSRAVPGLALLALTLGPAIAGAEDLPKAELQVVKYAELGKKIAGLKGKIVVVDFWADT